MSAFSIILMWQKRRRFGPSGSTGMLIEECALRSARCDPVIRRNGGAVERVFGMLPVAARDAIQPMRGCEIRYGQYKGRSACRHLTPTQQPQCRVDPDFTERLGR